MEKIMACTPTRDSIAKEVEKTAVSVIDIPPEWPKCCIYRVPKQLRKVKEEAYTPKLVSIGPFHHGAAELMDMEKHKQRYLMQFLERTTKSKADLLNFIKVQEKTIRHCYSEDCGPESSDDFVTMILLDAVFIIELFDKKTHYILSKPWLANGIRLDLILVENQLPFFVLEKLYRFAFGNSSKQIKEHKDDLKKEDTQFVKLSCNYFGCLSHYQEGQQNKEHKVALKKEDSPFVKVSRNYFRCYDKEPKSIIPIGKKVKHFTDLLRYLFCPPNTEQYWKHKMDQEKKSSGTRFRQFCPKMEQQWNYIKEKRKICRGKCWDSSKKTKEDSIGTRFCATKLDDAGFKFKGVKDDRRLLDIQPPGVLRCIPCFGRPMEVPQLVIDDDTETLLRNLMAMEQCLYPFQTYICSYLFLLDRLIDTEKDVDLLVHKKVIDNQLGSNKIVAKLINKLCDNIVICHESSYFSYIGKKLDEHYEYFLNRAMATLKREYCPNIFRGTASLLGLVVLLFTLWSFVKPFVV